MSARDRLDAAMAAAAGERQTISDPADLPPLLAAWRDRTQIAATCGHDLDGVVMVGLLGAPGHVYCPTCAQALIDAQTALGFTCDGCGQPAAGSLTWRAAPDLLVVGALCRSCSGRTDA